MTVAEIQDNKWELQAIKPPTTNAAAIGMILMMVGFSLFFVFLIIGSVIGSFTDTKVMDFEGKAAAHDKAATE
jgi:hypothetical protein